MSGCCGGKKSCDPAAVEKGEDSLHSSVSEFYASKQKTAELASAPPPCASACPISDPFPPLVQQALDLVHQDVKGSYFGCGLPYPAAVRGARVLDLGSGTGRDVFLLAALAGAQGSVVGVDMTPAMLAKSRAMIPYHAEKLGFSNVEFRQGVLEELDAVEGLQPASFDIIISNCVINLTADKSRVLRHAFNLLKPGGELCFSDVYVDAPLPQAVVENKSAWNECYSGALVWSDFLRISVEIGFLPPMILSQSDYVAYNQELAELLSLLTTIPSPKESGRVVWTF